MPFFVVLFLSTVKRSLVLRKCVDVDFQNGSTCKRWNEDAMASEMDFFNSNFPHCQTTCSLHLPAVFSNLLAFFKKDLKLMIVTEFRGEVESVLFGSSPQQLQEPAAEQTVPRLQVSNPRAHRLAPHPCTTPMCAPPHTNPWLEWPI